MEPSTDQYTDAARVAKRFQLKMELSNFKQGDMLVLDYFTELRMIWGKYVRYDAFPECSCGAMKGCKCDFYTKLEAKREKEFTFHFLMGLSKPFAPIRDEILHMKSFPDTNTVLSKVLQAPSDYKPGKDTNREGNQVFEKQDVKNPSNHALSPKLSGARHIASQSQLLKHPVTQKVASSSAFAPIMGFNENTFGQQAIGGFQIGDHLSSTICNTDDNSENDIDEPRKGKGREGNQVVGKQDVEDPSSHALNQKSGAHSNASISQLLQHQISQMIASGRGIAPSMGQHKNESGQQAIAGVQIGDNSTSNVSNTRHKSNNENPPAHDE